MSRSDRALARLSLWGRSRGLGWHEATLASQLATLVVLGAGVTAALAVSVWRYDVMPVAAYFVWLLLGLLLLRFRPLLVLTAYTLAAALVAFAQVGPAPARISGLVALVVSAALVLVSAARQRSDLPAALSGSMLAELRDRLQEQGRVPGLPGGWGVESAMLAAHGVGYAGDFMVAKLADDGRDLQMVLVDVCGKGVTAGPRSLQLAGALGGLIGSVPSDQMLGAANRFLMHQGADESFATAVQVDVDLGTGQYRVRCAGHPPALRWTASTAQWDLDGARGTALGVIDDPELHCSEGRLAPGDAMMFYTDGVVESRRGDLDDGIDWLRRTAAIAVGDDAGGFPGAAQRVIRRVSRGADDRAVLILRREAVGAPE